MRNVKSENILVRINVYNGGTIFVRLLAQQSGAPYYRSIQRFPTHPIHPTQPNPTYSSGAFLPLYMRDGKAFNNCANAKSME